MEKNVWRDELTLPQFADSWLPAISGTDPKAMMNVEVAFPFEWNCYESWNVVWRVRFDLSQFTNRMDGRLSTPVDVMDGWQSRWQECWVRIDHEARIEFEKRTGKPYMIGDNTYAEMRRIIQS